MRYFNDAGDIRFGKIVIDIILVLIALIVFFGSWGTVGAGERGIKMRFNAPTGTVVGEGVYFKIPLIERVEIVDVKVQKEEARAGAASSDLQTVSTQIALNYHLNPESVLTLYREVGLGYRENLIAPALQEAVKASTAKFNADELITKREVVRESIRTILLEKLSNRGIIIDAFNIVDFDFSSSFNAAIEAKVTAEQEALASKNKLEQVKYEAQQAIEKAKAEAESIRIQAQAVQTQGGADYVKLKAIEKWKGDVPTYMMGDTVPFVSLK